MARLLVMDAVEVSAEHYDVMKRDWLAGLRDPSLKMVQSPSFLDESHK